MLLGIKPGKKPGTTGIVGEAYKLAAVTLAPVFLEAFADIQDTVFDFASVPEHISETLWTPIAKKQGADTIQAVRDLEVPSEDTKVLERLRALLLDECVGGIIREHNEAFISGGDIMVNLFTMHEQFNRALTKRELHLLLLLDCAKGFNL